MDPQPEYPTGTLTANIEKRMFSQVSSYELHTDFMVVHAMLLDLCKITTLQASHIIPAHAHERPLSESMQE